MIVRCFVDGFSGPHDVLLHNCNVEMAPFTWVELHTSSQSPCKLFLLRAVRAPHLEGCDVCVPSWVVHYMRQGSVDDTGTITMKKMETQPKGQRKPNHATLVTVELSHLRFQDDVGAVNVRRALRKLPQLVVGAVFGVAICGHIEGVSIRSIDDRKQVTTSDNDNSYKSSNSNGNILVQFHRPKLAKSIDRALFACYSPKLLQRLRLLCCEPEQHLFSIKRLLLVAPESLLPREILAVMAAHLNVSLVHVSVSKIVVDELDPTVSSTLKPLIMLTGAEELTESDARVVLSWLEKATAPVVLLVPSLETVRLELLSASRVGVAFKLHGPDVGQRVCVIRELMSGIGKMDGGFCVPMFSMNCRC
jgi:hypothetical protein